MKAEKNYNIYIHRFLAGASDCFKAVAISNPNPSGGMMDRPRYDTEFLPNSSAMLARPPIATTPQSALATNGPNMKKRGERSGDAENEQDAVGFRRSSGLMEGQAPFFHRRILSGGHREFSRLE
jgi:hypothetical protein